MTEAACSRAVALYRAVPGPRRALLVDYDEVFAAMLVAGKVEVAQPQREITGRAYEATDLWFATTPRHYRAVVIARRASAKDLYRVLCLAERLVAPGGVLVLACVTDPIADHVYQEATEVFLATHPEYQRTLYQTSQVIELRMRS